MGLKRLSRSDGASDGQSRTAGRLPRHSHPLEMSPPLHLLFAQVLPAGDTQAEPISPVEMVHFNAAERLVMGAGLETLGTSQRVLRFTVPRVDDYEIAAVTVG
jgi:hypothetical protein